MARKAKQELKQYIVPVQLVFNCRAMVKAASPEEAREKARSADWEDSGILEGEMVDWNTQGEAEEDV